MHSFPRHRLALLLAITLVPLVASGQTDPVGFYRITVPQSSRATGLPLCRTAVASGTIESKTSNTLVAAEATNIGKLLAIGNPYFLEVTGGTASTYVGDRFDVNVSQTISANSNSIVISTGSGNNTRSTLPNLAGYTFVIRPHATLLSAFGTTTLKSASTASGADQIKLYNTSSKDYDIYFVYKSSDGSTVQWRKSGAGTTSYNKQVIAPGRGFILKRTSSTDVKLTFSGDVRTSEFFAQPLKAGYNLVAEGYPLTVNPNKRDCTTENGFTGATSSTSADQLKTIANDTSYYLHKNSSVEQWRKVGGGTKSYNTSNLFIYSGAVFIKKKTADAGYAAPKPF